MRITFEILKKHFVALGIFSLLSVVFCAPILHDIYMWGIHDWDQHFFYNAVPRKSLLKYHQFPLWNPYYCGGNVMLANPQSAFLSPLFIVEIFILKKLNYEAKI